MARKRYTAEEIISQLRTVEIETAKGIGIVDACRTLGITEQTYVPVEERIRWLARGSGQTVEGLGTGECTAETARRGSLSRQ